MKGGEIVSEHRCIFFEIDFLAFSGIVVKLSLSLH